jgi:ceramide glucosyltransferase
MDLIWPSRGQCRFGFAKEQVMTAHWVAAALAMTGLAATAAYALLAVIAVGTWRLYAKMTLRRATSSASPPPVTILKPLCGAEPGLYENLRTFCRQNYPQFQIVFGVRDTADPACGAVQRLAAEFPNLPITLVADSNLHGSNRKVSNLINMLPHAHHDIFIMADSDAAVGPDYLHSVVGPLGDRAVGLVTCLYRAVPRTGLWSRLGAMYINDWYMPAVLIARLFGYEGYVSGQTLCLRRDTLDRIGGLKVLASHLAEDHRLGQLVRALGLRVVLSPYLVDGEHHEPDFLSLSRHELRWMRTIRALRPRSFGAMFVTFSLPMAALGLALAALDRAALPPVWSMFAFILAARVLLHWGHGLSRRPLATDLWLLPLRDLLLCMTWCRSLFTSRVSWRGSEFDVDADGVMHRAS